MLSKIYKWALGLVALIAGVLALLLGIQTQKNKTLAAEANEAKKTAEKASEQLETVNAAVQKAEEKRKEVLASEASFDNIKKETAAAVETVKPAKTEPKATRHLGGKWIIVFAILFMASGCASNLTECRTQYPCPDNVCVQVTPPTIPLLPRPQSADVSVDYDSELNGYLITNEQFDIIEANEAALRATIEGYEKLITVYNEWRLRQ
ncbi:MAG: hypothetical protein AB7F25_07135 [Deferribacterales bacterium]